MQRFEMVKEENARSWDLVSLSQQGATKIKAMLNVHPEAYPADLDVYIGAMQTLIIK